MQDGGHFRWRAQQKLRPGERNGSYQEAAYRKEDVGWRHNTGSHERQLCRLNLMVWAVGSYCRFLSRSGPIITGQGEKEGMG